MDKMVCLKHFKIVLFFLDLFALSCNFIYHISMVYAIRYSVASNYLITIDYGNVLAKRFSFTVKPYEYTFAFSLARAHTHSITYVYNGVWYAVVISRNFFFFILHACVYLCGAYVIIHIVVECRCR